MPWRESYDIPNVRHEAPIPMAARVGNLVNTSWIPGRSMETGEVPDSVEEQAQQSRRIIRTPNGVTSFAGVGKTEPDDRAADQSGPFTKAPPGPDALLWTAGHDERAENRHGGRG